MNDQEHINLDSVFTDVLHACKTIAVVGASPKPRRPSYQVMDYMISNGYTIVPINPGFAGDTILGQTVYASLDEVPCPIDMVDVFRNSRDAGGVVDEAIRLKAEKRIQVVWLQIGVTNDAAKARAEAAGLTVIQNRCPKIEHARLVL